jgi:chemotaxis protein methyltransferase CheR/two-component system CheB/CheR fusion protein
LFRLAEGGVRKKGARKIGIFAKNSTPSVNVVKINYGAHDKQSDLFFSQTTNSAQFNLSSLQFSFWETEKMKLARSGPSNSSPDETHRKAASEKKAGSNKAGLFVVGIGASAGGLEAMEEFLKPTPPDCGLAFVIVQHLSPNHKGLLPELIQRITPMKVMQARNKAKVRAGCVYIIPPDRNLTIANGALILTPLSKSKIVRSAIDGFFQSLAKDCGTRAIGVVLSGMGTDGTEGARYIKENGGVILVQSPETAKFQSMPRSVLDAGLADFVIPPGEMIARILSRADPSVLKPPPPPEKTPEEEGSALDRIVHLLRGKSGNDFAFYKKNTVCRRVERRMGLHQLDTLDAYARFIRKNPNEIDLLFKELLIGVTSFFRDPAVWDYLAVTALPELFAAYPQGKMLRAWVPACSTGEEAYSLAIVFREALKAAKPKGEFTLQIFATDLDKEAITQARQGCFAETIRADVSPERLSEYFVREDGRYRIGKSIREMVVFAQQNVITDPPFTKLDILSCRNLLIYFGQGLQASLLPLFHYALLPKGVLLLGSAESVGRFSNLFLPLEGKLRLFRRLNDMAPVGQVDFPTKGSFHMSNPVPPDRFSSAPDNLQVLADDLILGSYSPAAVLVTEDGEILYLRGRTGKYLEPPVGKANLNIHAMAREGLRQHLSGILREAVRKQTPLKLSNLQVETDTGIQAVNVTVQAIDKPEALRGRILVVFNDAANGTSIKKRAGKKGGLKSSQALEDELAQIKLDLIGAREEMQSSYEEYKSINEELQSANEELQSTNEELTTSKEEMQSMNEELQTVNAELQSKIDELSSVHNDMKNLLNSTEVAAVFLDNALLVRRFTTHLSQIFKLIPSDVGRPLSDVHSIIDYPDMLADAEKVLHTLVFVEKQVPSQDGRWFRARIMPYRTNANVIEGVVITFVDISELKRLEAELAKK